VGQVRLLVPSSVFADLVDPNEASLTREGTAIILSIQGGDGAEGYIVRAYFDAQMIRRRTLSSLLMPDKPTEDTRYTRRVLKDR
jgi:hypothetical protein